MLGYVNVYKPELKIKDYEVYKGVYCSICKKLGRKYGLLARSFLSYDFTFLAILRLALVDKDTIFCDSRCSFNPLIKCKCCNKNNDVIDFATDCLILTVYYKLCDNINDSSILKKIPYLLAFPYVKLLYLKAKKSNPEIEQIIKEAMEKQQQLEKNNEDNIDYAAEPTAIAMSKILSYKVDDRDTKRIYERMGYCIGRWIYIIDATDDLKKDRKSKNYNPFLLYDKKFSNTEIFSRAKEILELTVSEIIDAYNLLEYNQFDDIIKNVLYYGMYNKMSLVLSEGGKKENEKSI